MKIYGLMINYEIRVLKFSIKMSTLEKEYRKSIIIEEETKNRFS